MGRAPRISLSSAEPWLSVEALQKVEDLGWPYRMKMTVLYTAGLNVITSSVQADRNRLLHSTEIPSEYVLPSRQDATL